MNDGARDFDFLHGEWKIVNRRLTERLVGCETWESFDATLSVRPVLGGLGNVDTFKTEWNDVEALTLRLFNPATGEWSLYWADNRDGVLHPPVVGRFSDGRGEFFARIEHEGRPVLARFVWDEITADSARWEQAYSTDDGETWETNWVMRFTRTG